MRIIEEKIYKFDELSKEVQEKLIEKEQENVRNDYAEFCLYDDMVEESKELLKKYFGSGAELTRVLYDLSYCQGSGAMIEFDINIVDLNKKYKVFNDEEIRFLTDKVIVNDIKVRHNNSRYCHEYSFGIDYGYYNCWNFEDIKDDYKITEDGFNTLWDRFDKLTDDSNKHYTDSEFIKDIIKMNEELARFGYNTIEDYEEDTDFVIENLSENEYYEDGSVYYG